MVFLILKSSYAFAVYEDNVSINDISVNSESVEAQEIKGTVYAQHLSNEVLFESSIFALLEISKNNQNSDFKFGLAFDSNQQEAQINTFSYTHYFDSYEIKIGKFVSKVGVLDFFSAIDVFNTTRIQYYDEEDINLRKKPSLLAQVNFFSDEESTLSVIVAPFDNDRRSYIDQALSISLGSGVPYYLLNSGDEDIDLIARPILLPAYEGGGKQALDRYIDGKLPEEHISIETTTVGLNYLTYHEQATFGVMLLSGYSHIPLITLDEDLIQAVANLDQEDKGTYISNYLTKDENEPIKSIEYFRYHLAAIYAETSIQSFGLRAEISYRDKFPLINTLTEQVTAGIGIDHKGELYNNLEMQYIYMPEQDITAYYALWQLNFEPVRIGEWDTTVQSTTSYAVLENEDIVAFIPAIKLHRKSVDISLEYLMHSQQEYMDNMAMLSVKAVF